MPSGAPRREPQLSLAQASVAFPMLSALEQPHAGSTSQLLARC